MSTCGGPSKSGLVPRHGQMSSGVRVVGRGSMMLTCKSPSSNAYVGGGKKLGKGGKTMSCMHAEVLLKIIKIRKICT